MNGALYLPDASALALQSRAESEARPVRLAEVRALDPDLADAIVEQRIGLDEAEASAVERRDREQAVRKELEGVLRKLDAVPGALRKLDALLPEVEVQAKRRWFDHVLAAAIERWIAVLERLRLGLKEPQ